MRWKCVAASRISSLACFEGWQFCFWCWCCVVLNLLCSIPATKIQLHVLIERLQLGNRTHSVMLNSSSCLVMRTVPDLPLWGALHVTQWPLKENVAAVLLRKIRKTKTWLNPELIAKYDVERLKTVVWLDSTRLLTYLDHFEFISAWGLRDAV